MLSQEHLEVGFMQLTTGLIWRLTTIAVVLAALSANDLCAHRWTREEYWAR